MSSPAEKRGLVIGKEYIYTFDNGEKMFVTFKRDDGTDIPAFYIPKQHNSDGWDYLYLDKISEVENKPVDSSPDTPYTFNVGKSTEITVSKYLTKDQVKRIIDIITE